MFCGKAIKRLPHAPRRSSAAGEMLFLFNELAEVGEGGCLDCRVRALAHLAPATRVADPPRSPTRVRRCHSSTLTHRARHAEMEEADAKADKAPLRRRRRGSTPPPASCEAGIDLSTPDP